jgi:hypothetical protein
MKAGGSHVRNAAMRRGWHLRSSDAVPCQRSHSKGRVVLTLLRALWRVQSNAVQRLGCVHAVHDDGSDTPNRKREHV